MRPRGCGLADTLEGDGSFTVFAPSNEAFERLQPGSFHDLLHVEHREKLKALLPQHVVPGQLRRSDLETRMEVKSVGNAQLGITYNFITGVRIGTPDHMAHVQNSDVEATNGVIHVIDRVIMP